MANFTPLKKSKKSVSKFFLIANVFLLTVVFVGAYYLTVYKSRTTKSQATPLADCYLKDNDPICVGNVVYGDCYQGGQGNNFACYSLKGNLGKEIDCETSDCDSCTCPGDVYTWKNKEYDIWWCFKTSEECDGQPPYSERCSLTPQQCPNPTNPPGATPTDVPTSTPSPFPPTVTLTPTVTPTPPSAPRATMTPTLTPTVPASTNTPIPTVTPTSTITPTPTVTPTGTVVPSNTPTPTPTTPPGQPTNTTAPDAPTATPTEIIIAKVTTSPTTGQLLQTGVIKSFLYWIPAIIVLIGLIL